MGHSGENLPLFLRDGTDHVQALSRLMCVVVILLIAVLFGPHVTINATHARDHPALAF
jgi:hypothetical protein